MTPSPLLERIKLFQWNQSLFTSNYQPAHPNVILAAKWPCDSIKQRNNPWHFHEKGKALSDLSKHCCSIRDFWGLPCCLWGNRVAGPGELYIISWLWNRKNNWEAGNPRSLLLAIGIWMCLVGTVKETGALIFVVLPASQSAALQMWMVTPCSNSVILAQRAGLQ